MAKSLSNFSTYMSWSNKRYNPSTAHHILRRPSLCVCVLERGDWTGYHLCLGQYNGHHVLTQTNSVFLKAQALFFPLPIEIQSSIQRETRIRALKSYLKRNFSFYFKTMRCCYPFQQPVEEIRTLAGGKRTEFCPLIFFISRQEPHSHAAVLRFVLFSQGVGDNTNPWLKKR